MGTSVNKSIRESERRRKKELREAEGRARAQQSLLDKVQKTISKTTTLKEKVFDSLEDTYASGKIDKGEYEKLKGRQTEITEDILLIGKKPIQTLSTRYITGKIDKKEFERMKLDLLPADFFTEKEGMENQLKLLEDGLRAFLDECSKEKGRDHCQYCGRKTSFFNNVTEFENLLLCSDCKKSLSSLLNFPGFNGKYYVIEPFRCSVQDIVGKNLHVKVRLSDEVLLGS